MRTRELIAALSAAAALVSVVAVAESESEGEADGDGRNLHDVPPSLHNPYRSRGASLVYKEPNSIENSCWSYASWEMA